MKNKHNKIFKPKRTFVPDEHWPEWVKNYKSKWPEIKGNKQIAMANTAVTQLVSALIMGEMHYLTEKRPEVAWYKVPQRYTIAAVTDPDSDEILIEDAQAREVLKLGYNPEAIIRYIIGGYQVDEEGNKHYVCELTKYKDSPYWHIDAPMNLIYMAAHHFVVENYRARLRMAKRGSRPPRRKK